ncbi:FAD/NAD(P)-binding domain-containing protein [Laetiporus sulphureus 93-53]|uniref:FAD/NAD(P)-binding domain-containing protein n=1 Tax=Laetiporus sulphureus 93-53 TaxID=1314785 RepID=A0A165EPU7_9APHY|nr:FAD/NAD(P)-binding domain-containing protein [Laetiporus sulphureus 93-53]KZT07513.1 FAD/NAD(P)-binding domain-containing protein [Laetiporus sulphureus 93-53]
MKSNVVIVGGGHAGAHLARSLSGTLDPSRYNLILVNERPFAIHLLAGARMTVTTEGNIDSLALIPYDKLFINGNGRLVVDRVTAIEETAPGQGRVLVLQSGERLPYAVVVLACGFSWSGPLDFPYSHEDMRAHLANWRKRYARAQHVVLIGGGAVGIETAGELRDMYPDKKITIVQADTMLLNATYPEKYRREVERRVRARNIDCVFSELTDYVPEYAGIGLTTRSGMALPTADLIVPTFGPRPNTAWIASLGADVLDERGLVRIEPTFEVVGHPGVFAIGDITDCNEQKQAQKYPAHVAVAVPNIMSYLEGRPLTKTYKGSMEIILIPIGKNRGVAYYDLLWGVIVGDWFVRWLKGKDLFVKKTRRARGLAS